MGTLSDRGRDALVRRQKQAAGVTVTYTRKATGQALALTAVPGITTAVSSELPGRVEIAQRDYLIAVADLTGGPPEIGDRITETINGAAVTFEVMTPESEEPAWRYSSQWRAMYRAHCQRV